MTELSQYVLQPLREDGKFTLYRGRRNESEPVLLLTPIGAECMRAQVELLEQELSFATELDLGWAARPLALIRHNELPALVLEDCGGDPLRLVPDRPLEMTAFLRLANSIVAAVRQMHRRGIVHNDIKPANVLVDADGNAKLTGFGIASRLARGRQTLAPTADLKGTLAYMSPEQTGRMNRSIDARSDLYSLGITLYEMLTGALPFTASNPIEWVHSHIARHPKPPRDRVQGIPAALEAIVLKLLKKNAEDRYQTAAALEADLRRCLSAWTSLGHIDQFPLAQGDAPGGLLISETLYGREHELKTLITTFERVAKIRSTELVFISGSAGVGKSSLVKELRKALVPFPGLFATGKFEQYKRDIPYATLAQAFQSLVRELLCMDENELARWRAALVEALGQNAQLLVNLVPELELVIGPQPSVTELPPADAQNRFLLVFRRFLGVFARPEQPLVIFLDDMQWLDDATIRLVEQIVKDPAIRNLFLICAYRDDEIGPTHPLARMLTSAVDAESNVQTLMLRSLSVSDVTHLVATTVNAAPNDILSLAELVFAKTGGNPFFTTQFLTALADDELITFDQDSSSWQWDVDQLTETAITDNVAVLMAGKLAKLPKASLETMKVLACLGNAVGIRTLAIVFPDSKELVQSALQEAVRAGLVLRSDESYAFAHDRVQEAAYAFIPECDRPAMHLHIGRRLLSGLSSAEILERIFDIVDHLNRGVALISDFDERQQVAELNLAAGKRAKEAMASASALTYLSAGEASLSIDGWERCNPLAFALALQRAECEYMIGDMESAERRLTMLAGRCRRLEEQAALARFGIEFYTNLDQADHAIEMGLDYLRLVGINWSAHPTDEEVALELARFWELISDRAIEALIELPQATEPIWCATLEVLNFVHAPANFTDGNLVSLVIIRMANITLEHGCGDGSGLAFVYLGMILESRFDDYRVGFCFGKLGIELAARDGRDRFKARAFLNFGNAVSPWAKPITAGIEVLQRAIEISREAGDLTFMAYGYMNIISARLVGGNPLEKVEREAEAAIDFVRHIRFGTGADLILGHLGLVRALRGLTSDLSSFTFEEFDELSFERRLEGDPTLSMARCWYWIRKLQACFLAGRIDDAIFASTKAASLLWTSPAFLIVTDYHFYSALARAAQYREAVDAARGEILEALDAHKRQFDIWAGQCSDNFLAHHALISAEISQIHGRELEAQHYYEEAIRSAKRNGFVHNEALGSELAAKFYASRGLDTIADAHLRNARAAYDRWGASAKVLQLDQAYHCLAEVVPSRNDNAASASHLELATVIKIAQAVSSEIDLRKLIEAIMLAALEHAGADRGLLLLPSIGEPRVEAEAAIVRDRIEVRHRSAPVSPAELPESVLRYVLRTKESLLLDDVTRDELISRDEYFSFNHVRSILCLPLLKQTRTIGVLYLENTQASHAFTPARNTVLTLLASQAAISLENARLYSELRQKDAYLAEAQRLSHTGSFGWDVSSGEIVWSNETFRIFDFDPTVKPTIDAVMSRVHPDDVDAVAQFVERVPRDGKDWEIQHRLLMPDRSVKYLHVVGHVVRNSPPDISFVGAVMDVTATKKAESAAHQAHAELAHASRMTTLGELSAAIAHEVNQPLTSIATNASACVRWLAKNPPELEEARSAVERIHSSTHQASDVIRSIRAMAVKSSPQMVELDFNQVIATILALMRTELYRQNVSLETDFPGTIMPVKGDRVLLQQVLLNLVRNGIEAMSEVHDRQRLLRVCARDGEDRNVLISVEDTGIGLDPEMIDRIFDPLFTTKRDGMGMGLRICQSIVESHGGKLSAARRQPHGSIFSFSLPSALCG